MTTNVKHEHGWGSYYVVFNALILLTIITVGLSYVDVGQLITSALAMLPGIRGLGLEFGHGANIVLGLLVAVIKAGLVLWFFMHQKDEESLNRFTLGFCVGLFFLALLVFSTDFVFLKTYAFRELAGMAVAGH